MITKLTQTLQRLQTDWAAQLQSDAIQAACDAVGYTQWRDRLLNPVVTVQVFLLQMLHGNTACRHLPHLSGLHFSASAYCQARMKLPLGVLEHLVERVSQSVRSTALHVQTVRFVLDAPVSNAGRLAQQMRALATTHAWPWEVVLVPSADAVLRQTAAIVATSDSGILDAPVRWYDLAAAIVAHQGPTVWCLDLHVPPPGV